MSEADLQDRERATYNRGESAKNNASMRRILEVLVVAAIGGLFTSVWLLKESVAVQQASLVFLKEQMADIKQDQREDRRRIDELRGNVFRGIDEGRDPLHALDK